MDKLVAAMTGARHARGYFRRGTQTTLAGIFYDHWLTGGFPGGGAAGVPAGGLSCDNTTPGALLRGLPVPQSGESLYLTQFQIWCANSGFFFLVDRIWHNNNLSALSTAVQAVNSPALPARVAGGAGVQPWITTWAAPTTPAATGVTMQYVNQDGVAKSAYTPPLWSPILGRIGRLTLADGDSGVRSVTSIQFDTASNAAGNVGVVLVKRIADAGIYLATNASIVRDVAQVGMPLIDPTSCLSLIQWCYTSATGDLFGTLGATSG